MLGDIVLVGLGCPEGTPSGKLVCIRIRQGLLPFRIRKHGLLLSQLPQFHLNKSRKGPQKGGLERF